MVPGSSSGWGLPLSFRIPHSTFRIVSNWFNQVDTTYRGDLREINELNFSRFDAKLEQRLAQFDAKLEQRLAQSDAKWEQRLGELRAELGALHGALRAELGELRGEFRAQLKAEGKRLMGWMVGLWITAIGVLGGLIFAAVRFLPVARP
jgi:hypothetical protein